MRKHLCIRCPEAEATAPIRQVHVPGIGEHYVMDPPKDRGQWLVAARHDGLLSIMTPVYPDQPTLQLLLNQVSCRKENFRGACS